MSDSSAEERRRHRLATMSVRRFALGEEPDDDLSASTTIEQRLAMMPLLAMRAWSLTGKPLPNYTRASIPSRIVRGR